MDTNVGRQLLDQGKVGTRAKIYDGEQKVGACKEDYHQGDQNLGKEVEFYYVKPQPKRSSRPWTRPTWT
ncbi:hypothetical protein QJS66_10060 [Kocuria rhizophila]|nr:hypothetical protein QJS66_10060 [Kocuria rhizophila]